MEIEGRASAVASRLWPAWMDEASSGDPHEAEKHSVLVTLADHNWVDPAKQLFASAWSKAGWSGDRLLLARGMDPSDMRWFESKGVIVHPCTDTLDDLPSGRPAVIRDKANIFGSDFSRWRAVIYCDADCIVRAPLRELTTLTGFWAVRDVSGYLRMQIIDRAGAATRGTPAHDRRRAIQEIRKIQKLSAPCFNSGLMVFPGADLRDELRDKAEHYTTRFQPAGRYGEQLAFNLLFPQWKELPTAYNFQVTGGSRRWHHQGSEADAIVLHFVAADKPWMPGSPFQQEWLSNLATAQKIGEPVPAVASWDNERTATSSALLHEDYLVADEWRQRLKRITPSGFHWAFTAYRESRRFVRRRWRALRGSEEGSS